MKTIYVILGTISHMILTYIAITLLNIDSFPRYCLFLLYTIGTAFYVIMFILRGSKQ